MAKRGPSMSKNQAWLLSLIVTGLLGCTGSGAETKSVPQQVERASAQSSETAPLAKRASTPESKQGFLLAQEASELANRRDYAGALSKLEAAIAIRSDVPEYSMMRCMLSERVTSQPQLECYASVVRAYEASGPPCESNLNCVVAASMASSPEASRYRTRYLALPKSPEEQGITESMLKNFSRDTVLNSILP